MTSGPYPTARWPEKVAAGIQCLRGAGPEGREASRARLWPLLHAGLFASLRAQAGRVVATSPEDLEDLASQKALELLLRAEEGAWDIEGRTPLEIAGYVARVARHALVDLARQRGRECAPPDDPEAWDTAVTDRSDPLPRPEDALAAREFALALGECAGQLAPRSRQAWFRRVFLERPSREIASSLGIQPAHVDVVVQRARAAIRDCMRRRGLRDVEVMAGLFVELWQQFGDDAAVAGDGGTGE